MSAVAESGSGIVAAKQRPYLAARKGYTFFVEGDVLFAKITPCMQNGKHAIAGNLIDGIGFGSTEFHVLRAHDEVLPQWIYYSVTRPEILRDAAKHLVGVAGQQRVPPEFLAELSVPLPPLPEQKRIVEILDEADRLRKLRKQADTRTRDLLPALFLQMFGDPRSNPKGYEVETLGDLAHVSWGNTSITKRSYQEDSTAIAFSASGPDGHLPIAEHHGPGIVISAIGARCGKCYWADGKWTAIKNTLTITKPVARIDLRYLFAIVNDESFWQRRGVAQPFIGLNSARSQKILVPPLDLQRKFSAIVTETEQQIEKQKQSAQRIEDLFQSLLHECFA